MARVSADIEFDRSGARALVNGATAGAINTVLTTARNVAVQIAPQSGHTVRPAGHIRIRGNHFIERANSNSLRGTLGNRAPHARIVHEGRGPITATGKPMVWVNAGGPYPGKWVRRRVAGASAQPWLVRAVNRSLELHPEINIRGTLIPENRTRV